MGAIMYTLAHVDFSNRLGVVFSELPSDEIDRQEQTLDAKQGAALRDLATASSPGRELETALNMAVFSAP
jgi:hypothetical protein